MIEIRSYRRVFELERRIYRVDHLRLNPGGVPVRGVVYLLAIVALAAVLGRLPVAGAVLGALPWYLSDVALPLVAASVLCVITVEGRPFHLAAAAVLRSAVLAPARRGLWADPRSGRRWSPPPVVCLPDGSDARLRRLRYRGPGAIAIAVPHRRWEATRRGPTPRGHGRSRRGARLVIEQAEAAGRVRREVIVLEQRATVDVRLGDAGSEPD